MITLDSLLPHSKRLSCRMTLTSKLRGRQKWVSAVRERQISVWDSAVLWKFEFPTSSRVCGKDSKVGSLFAR